ncbi:Laminin subunit gamma-1 [Wickerhamomyces ciferrii]|uniref:Laminin subunit gamma-1 n=1 Tax=Wickerhamomyces ciferrii (strain ATCC 14091 / BCRC 22168 / CBS 111 / JCM 3599 / NBRC 0793 / NRRL Y-1031 F-60-10) TaxID=1206466 RepID=K0KDH1_WICCF|nr:Laminin subunit gamma-1 [Wickerhamomyces ciferrii]CCH43165.1 Laminin subunit gamma-1 [Wickerhamomyces ciferrii]
MAYSDQTVAQLKEELTSRQLSTSGVKKDLIQRLEENDASKETTEPVVEESKDEPKDELLEEVEPEQQEESKEESKEEQKEESSTTEQKGEEEKPKSIKEFTPEERKNLAIEFLNKKISRAKKFGSEESEIESIKKDLARIEKYGVELGTSIAKEIGLTSRPLHDGPRKRFHGRGRGGNRGFRSRGRFRGRRD